MEKIFQSILRTLLIGLVQYGRYTCGVYWDDVNNWCYYLYEEYPI